MKLNRILILLSLLTLCFFSCKDTKKTENTNTEEVIPKDNENEDIDKGAIKEPEKEDSLLKEDVEKTESTSDSLK